MFTKVERLISSRNLKPKRKEGFLKIISIFSFVGIMLGVAILIIVMSVMNGFKTDLTNKILGLNPHIVVQPNNFIIDNEYVKKLIMAGINVQYASKSYLKILRKIKWKSKIKMKKGLSDTLDWYLQNKDFIKSISKKLYVKRLGLNL